MISFQTDPDPEVYDEPFKEKIYEAIDERLEPFELSEDDYKDRIDELYEPINIGPLQYPASQVLYELDPVAFRCGRNDEENFIVSDDSTYIEIFGDYYERNEVSNLIDELLELEAEEDES